MIITSQGFGHFKDGINNQDFGIESEKMVLILDGCSAAKYSDSGVRLFGQLFSRKEECNSLEKFEDNVKSVFDDIIGMMEKYYPIHDELEEDYIDENLLFTMIACFETEDKFIVKLFGDGYIITQNVKGLISYMKFAYGACPPYFAYKYCNWIAPTFKDYHFKTFTFDKTIFKKVLIATDGIMPVVKYDMRDLDTGITTENFSLIEAILKERRTSFYDDVTIGMLGGKK